MVDYYSTVDSAQSPSTVYSEQERTTESSLLAWDMTSVSTFIPFYRLQTYTSSISLSPIRKSLFGNQRPHSRNATQHRPCPDSSPKQKQCSACYQRPELGWCYQRFQHSRRSRSCYGVSIIDGDCAWTSTQVDDD